MGSSFLFTAPGAKIRKAPVILTRKMASAGWWVSYSVLGMGKARLVDRALVGVFGCYAARWLDNVSRGGDGLYSLTILQRQHTKPVHRHKASAVLLRTGEVPAYGSSSPGPEGSSTIPSGPGPR